MALTEVKAAFWTAKVVTGLVLAVALGVMVALFGADYAQMRKAAAQNEQRGQVLVNTSAGVADGVEIDQVQEAYKKGLDDARSTFQQAKSEAKRNEPETASRAGRAVPDSVRSAYRERRRSRERLGCVSGECPQDDNANAPAKR